MPPRALQQTRRLEIFNRKPGLGVASAMLTWQPAKHSSAHIEADIRKLFRLPPTTSFSLQNAAGEPVAISPNLPTGLTAYLVANSPPASPAAGLKRHALAAVADGSAAAAAASDAGSGGMSGGPLASPSFTSTGGLTNPAALTAQMPPSVLLSPGSGGAGGTGSGGNTVAPTPTSAALAFIDHRKSPLPDLQTANSIAANAAPPLPPGAAGGSAAALLLGSKSRTPQTPVRSIKKTLSVQPPPVGSGSGMQQPLSAPAPRDAAHSPLPADHHHRNGSNTSMGMHHYTGVGGTAHFSPIRERERDRGDRGDRDAQHGGWTSSSGRPPSGGRGAAARVVPFAYRPLHHHMSDSLSSVTLGGMAPKALSSTAASGGHGLFYHHHHGSPSRHGTRRQSDPSLHEQHSDGGSGGMPVQPEEEESPRPQYHAHASDASSSSSAAAAAAAYDSTSAGPASGSSSNAMTSAALRAAADTLMAAAVGGSGSASGSAASSGAATPAPPLTMMPSDSHDAKHSGASVGAGGHASGSAPSNAVAVSLGVSASMPNSRSSSPTNRSGGGAVIGFGSFNEHELPPKPARRGTLNKSLSGLANSGGNAGEGATAAAPGGRGARPSIVAGKRTSTGYGGFTDWQQSSGGGAASGMERGVSREISVEKIMLMLNSITQASTKVDIRELTEQITEQVNTLFGSDKTFLFLVNDSTPHNNSSNNTAHSSTVSTCWTADPSIPLPIAVGHGVVGWVASKGHSVQLPTGDKEREREKDRAKEREMDPAVNQPLMGFHAKTCLCVPVFAPDKASNAVTRTGPIVSAVLYTARLGVKAVSDATGAKPPGAAGAAADASVTAAAADPYSAHDMMLFKLLSTHVGIMIRNIKLFDAAQKIEARNQTLCQLLSQLPARLDDPTFVPAVLRQTQEHISADRCSLFLLDPVDGKLWAKNSDSGEDVYVPRDKGIMGQAVKSKRLVNVADVRADPSFNQHIDIRTGYCTQSMVAAPLLDEDQTVLGVTSFINRAGGTTFTGDEAQLIDAVSKLCSVGLRWPVLRSERDSLRARFACLREITSIITGSSSGGGSGGGATGGSGSSEDISVVIRKVMAKAQEMLGVDRCSMFLLDPDTKELFSRTPDGQEIRFSQYLGIAGHCATTGKPICVKDVKSDARFLPAVDRRTGFQTHNILCVPIRDTDTQIIGVMQCVNKFDGDFEPEDEETLLLISHLCSFLLLRHAYLQQKKRNAAGVNLNALLTTNAGAGGGGVNGSPAVGPASTPTMSSAAPPPFHKSMSLASLGGSKSAGNSGVSTPLGAGPGSSAFSLSPSVLTTKLQALNDKQRAEESKQQGAGAGGRGGGAGAGGTGNAAASNWVLFDIQGKPTGAAGQQRRAHPNFPQALENMTVFDLHAKKNDLIRSGDIAREEEQKRKAKNEPATAMENAHALFAMLGTHKTFGKLTHLFDFEGRKYSGWSPKRYISLRAKVDRDYLKSWDFNALTLSTDEILANVICMLEELHLVQLMDINKLCKFTGNIARSYRANPYHNFYHALDTMQAVYTFMTTSHVVNGALNTLDRLSGLLGAFCHDVDHPGVTSNFLINVNSPLALFYNDESVLENYHCSVSFLLMRDDEMNILSKLSPPDLKYVRKCIVATIMATDMAHHFRHITNLKTRIQNLPVKPFTGQSFDDRLMLTMLCMKCADLIHLVRPFKVAREWEELIQQEFFLQGDMEKELKLPIGPCNDRFTVDLAASQVYFYNAFGEPLFGSLVSFAPDLQHRLDTLRANCKIWAEEAKRNKLLKAAQQAQKEKEAAAPPPTDKPALAAPTATPSTPAPGGSAAAPASDKPPATPQTNANLPLPSGASGTALSSGIGLGVLGGANGLSLAPATGLKQPLSGGRSASRHASMVALKTSVSLMVAATTRNAEIAAAAAANAASSGLGSLATINSGHRGGPELSSPNNGAGAGGGAGASPTAAGAASPAAAIGAGAGGGGGSPTGAAAGAGAAAAGSERDKRRNATKLHSRRNAAALAASAIAESPTAASAPNASS